LLIKQTATPKTSDTDCRDRKTRQEQKNIKPLELSFFHILAISSHMASPLHWQKGATDDIIARASGGGLVF